MSIDPLPAVPTDRVVTSPGGDDVAIFTDEAFAELIDGVGDPRKLAVMLHFGSTRRAILLALWEQGAVENSSGRAASMLQVRANEYGRTPGEGMWASAALSTPAMAMCVERQTNGKRTYTIRLMALPESWFRMLSDVSQTPELSKAEHPTARPADVEVDVATAVAAALLTRVVDIIQHGNDTTPELLKLRADVENLQARLGEQTGYVDRLRRDLRLAQDQLVAAHEERDGLRRRAQQAEHNLKVATSSDTRKLIDDEVHKQVDRFMRERPAPSKAQ